MVRVPLLSYVDESLGASLGLPGVRPPLAAQFPCPPICRLCLPQTALEAIDSGMGVPIRWIVGVEGLPAIVSYQRIFDTPEALEHYSLVEPDIGIVGVE